MGNPNRPGLEVCLSPALIDSFDARGKQVVIIDIFRASSTITAALYHGAREVIPVDSVAKCIALGKTVPGALIAGERNGRIAEGLEYGNSPSEYPRDFVEGRTLVLTTTNGTRLLHMIKGESALLIGSFLNLGLLGEYLREKAEPVLLCCAGWKNRVNLEDTLFAGALADQLRDTHDIHCDSARMAMRLFRQAGETSLLDYLKDSAHYQRLASFGLESDMAYCLSTDRHPVIPYLEEGALRALPKEPVKAD